MFLPVAVSLPSNDLRFFLDPSAEGSGLTRDSLFLCSFDLSRFSGLNKTSQGSQNIPRPGRKQWRNVISGGPRFKIFEGPPSRSAKGTVERRICTSFLGVQGMITRKMFESRLSEMPFP